MDAALNSVLEDHYDNYSYFVGANITKLGAVVPDERQENSARACGDLVSGQSR